MHSVPHSSSFYAACALLSWLVTWYAERLSLCLFSGIVRVAATETNNLKVKDLSIVVNNTVKSAHVPMYLRMTFQRMIDWI